MMLDITAWVPALIKYMMQTYYFKLIVGEAFVRIREAPNRI